MFRSIFYTYFPAVCAICETVLNRNEKILCGKCLHHLPVFSRQSYAEETMKKMFYGRVLLAHAASLMHYRKKGPSQQLIHRLKYKGQEEISTYLGEWLAEELRQLKWAKTIDIVIPVPLHKTKKRKRGFNQVSGFGKALAQTFGCTYSEEVLIKVFNSKTQVFKDRITRAKQKDTAFTLQHSQEIKQKHVLLVDDIITTGATLETCTNELLKAGPSKISIATMAVTT